MSKFQVNLCMCMHVKAQNVRRHQMPYDIDRLLLMAPFGFWWSATPKFGKATFCAMKTDKVKCACARSQKVSVHSKYLHCPWANFAQILDVDYLHSCEHSEQALRRSKNKCAIRGGAAGAYCTFGLVYPFNYFYKSCLFESSLRK